MGLADKLNKAVEEIKSFKLVLRPEILLLPNIPRPLHGVAPRVVLGSKWWYKTKQAAYKSTDYHCVACGVHKLKAKSRQWMEAHEVYNTDYARGRLTYVETVPLCHYCHNYIHDGRMRHLLEQGKLHQSKFIAIIQHGDRVLSDAGLERQHYKAREDHIRKMLVDNKMAPWGSWRLVVEGAEYPPLYKTYQEWLEGHNE